MNFFAEIRKIPLFRIIVPFILGIIAYIHFTFIIPYAVVFLAGTVSIAFIVANTNFRYRDSIFVFFIFTSFFISGNALVGTHHGKKKNLKFEQDKTFIGEIIKEPKISEKTVKLHLNLDYYRDKNELIVLDEKTIVYLPIDTNSLQLSLGQKIIFNTNFQEIKNLGNPDEFDYKKYLANHQIYNQAFIQSDAWKILQIKSKLGIQSRALQLRNYIMHHFQKSGIEGQQLAVLSALALGYKNKLDAEIKHAYANSGGMHVLAVSGLHVGIIFFILAFLLQPLRNKKNGKYFTTGIIIIFLWFYAFLTGLSPSVFRASTMFSIIAIGTLFKKNTNIYNSLAASAFILLLVNPYLITEIGFQLSYLAVISIVYFHPKIYGWVNFGNKIIDKIWSLTAVSLAAQIATAPISIYYFGQFPVYFLLTNFIVIPFASILIYGTILFLIFSFINPVGLLLAKALNLAVYILNTSIQFIEQIPGSIITNIEFSGLSLILSYMAIIIFAAYFAYQKRHYFMYGFSILIVLLLSINIQKIMDKNTEQFIVFNVPGDTFIQLKDNGITTNIYNMKEGNENYVYKQYTGSNKVSKKIELKTKNNEVEIIEDIFLFQNKLIFIPTKTNVLQFKKPKEKLHIDYLVVTKNSSIKLKHLLEYIHAEQIIFDASLSYYQLEYLRKYCKRNNIPYYATKNSGAFVVQS